jgi:hypothetical protein
MTDLFDGGSNIGSQDTLTGRAQTQSILAGILGKGGSSSATTGGGWGGILSSLKASAPMLGLTLGAGLGASVGGQSRLGRVLGGVAGGALGLSAGLAGFFALGGTVGAGSLGTAAGVIAGALPFIAPIAGVLLVGSYLLGRNQRRREEEKIRDAAATDALSALDKLLLDVQRHRIDGSDALAQAAQIREQYLRAADKMKDKKTRNHHLQDVYRLDLKIANIRRAAETAMNDNRRFQNRLPEFATGGVVPGQKGEPRLVLAHGGERISSLTQMAEERVAAETGYAAGIRGNSGNGGRSFNVHVELSLGTETQNQLFVNGAKSDKGYNVIVRQSEKGLKKGDMNF